MGRHVIEIELVTHREWEAIDITYRGAGRDITAEDAAEQLRCAIKAATPKVAHPGG